MRKLIIAFACLWASTASAFEVLIDSDIGGVFGGTSVHEQPYVGVESGLPAAGTVGRTAFVTDGDDDADCTVGGGGFLVECMDNGSSWEATGHTQSHALDSGSDHTGELPDADLATGPAWTIWMRNVGSTGDRAPVAMAAIATDGTPVAGEFLLGFQSGGDIVRFDIGDLPGGGGTTIEINSAGVGSTVDFQDTVTIELTDTSDVITFDVVADSIGINELDETAAFQFSGAWNSTRAGVVDFADGVTASFFQADDRTVEPGNLITLNDNATAFTLDPTCVNSGTIDKLTIIDVDEVSGSSNADWQICNSKVIWFDIPNTGADILASGQILVGQPTAGEGLYVSPSGDMTSISTAGSFTIAATHAGGLAHHTRLHAFDSGSDHSGTLPDTSLETMLAYTLSMRNAGSTGSRADVKITGLSLEATPLALDFVMIERADGTLAYADIGTLPTGGGGEANTISGQESEVDLIHSSGKQGIDLRLVDLATVDFSSALDIISINASHSGSEHHSIFTPTDIDTDYGVETVTSAWSFVASGLGGLTDYDLSVGDTTTPDYGVIRIGDSTVGRTSFSGGSLDLGGAVMINNQGALDAGNDPGIEFAIVVGGNMLRLVIPESGAGNATAMFRSVTMAGPMTLNNNVVLCDTWSTYDSNIDCDTGATGADLFVQDDIELEGDIFLSGGAINFDSDDANQLTMNSANITVARTLTWPDDEVANLDVLMGTGAGTVGYVAQPAIDCTNCTSIPAGSHAGTIAWSGTSILETGANHQWGDDTTNTTLTHKYGLSTGTDPVIVYSDDNVDYSTPLSATSITLDPAANPSFTMEDSTFDDGDDDWQIIIEDNATSVNDTRAQYQGEIAGVMTNHLDANGLTEILTLGGATWGDLVLITDGMNLNEAELVLLDGLTVLSGDNTGDEPNAAAGTLGVIELDTDLGGSATAPTVVSVQAAAIIEASMAAVDFGDFTCGAGATDCDLNANVVDSTVLAVVNTTVPLYKFFFDYDAASITTDDDYILRGWPVAATITGIYCEAHAGTSFTIKVCDGEDAGDDTCANNHLDATESTTLECTTAGASDTSINVPNKTAREKVTILVTAVSGTVVAGDIYIEGTIN